MLFFVAKGLPDIKTIETLVPAETTKIYSYDNVALAELHKEENRLTVNDLDKISPILRNTVIAVEDTDFFTSWY